MLPGFICFFSVENLENLNVHIVVEKQLIKNDQSLPHLLVVDDEDCVAKLIQELLEMRGYRVTVETDSKKALLLFKQDPQDFDAVITDNLMPGMSGEELSSSISGIRSGIPIILCSGQNAMSNETQLKKSGVTQVINKPINTGMLFDVVKKSLKD